MVMARTGSLREWKRTVSSFASKRAGAALRARGQQLTAFLALGVVDSESEPVLRWYRQVNS